tara:strand:- start:1893 stop:2777 length:885 start_codon:yes stop_codon:yes gene_type:complete
MDGIMKYAKMPLEFLRDSRLSKNDLRVLAVLIFRSNKEGKCWPKRRDISELSGLPETRVSVVVKRLKLLGLLDIIFEPRKANEKPRRTYHISYSFNTKKVTEPVTNPNKKGYSFDTKKVTGSVTPTPINSFEHITGTKNVVSAKRISVFSKAEILSVKIPENLANEKGFISAWEKWVETKVNQSQKKNRWTEVDQVENCLRNLSKWFEEGFDILEGLETAVDRKWIGFRKAYFHLRNNERKQKLSKLEEIDNAFDDFRKANNEDHGIRDERNSEDTFRRLSEFPGKSVYNYGVG